MTDSFLAPNGCFTLWNEFIKIHFWISLSHNFVIKCLPLFKSPYHLELKLIQGMTYFIGKHAQDLLLWSSFSHFFCWILLLQEWWQNIHTDLKVCLWIFKRNFLMVVTRCVLASADFLSPCQDRSIFWIKDFLSQSTNKEDRRGNRQLAKPLKSEGTKWVKSDTNYSAKLVWNIADKTNLNLIKNAKQNIERANQNIIERANQIYQRTGKGPNEQESQGVRDFWKEEEEEERNMSNIGDASKR